MPREIKTKEDFQKLLPAATEVRVLRGEESAKVKLRTPEQLYTYKTSASEVDSLVKGLKIPVVEL
ncbi:MAG TPA: hypothetical protein VLY21_04600 [Nitrososphaerales archaeon]|nr:hypothetical protein [Nitrososphaerales archaeon]